MPGIQLFQANGVGTVNSAGDEHPSPIEVEAGLLCQLSPAGVSSATWRWVFSKPSSSASVLSSTTSAGPSFLPDVEAGSYSIRLYDDEENEYILDIVTPTVGSGPGGASGGAIVTTVNTYDDLRNQLSFAGTPPASFVMQCRETVDDGGGGPFAYDSTDTTTADNDGTVIVDVSGNRFKRIFSGPIDARWFGLSEASADNSDALQGALDAGNHLYIPAGTFDYSTRLVVATGQRIEGCGREAVLNYEGTGTAIRHENPTGTATAQMLWSNFSVQGGSSARIGIELVNAYGVTLSNVDVDGNNSGFDDAGIRITCAFGAFNAAVINIVDGTHVHECAGDGIQVYYPPDIAASFDAGTDRVTAASHGKLEGDLVLFGTDGSLTGTGITGGVQDFYFVRNPTANNFQVSLTATGAIVDILGAGTGNHKIVGPGAPVGGLNIVECLIDQCENGINCDAGTIGTAGEVVIRATTLQSNRRCNITGSFLRGEIADCHMEQGGAPLTGGAHILLGASQQVYSLRITGNLISGIVAGQNYSIDVTPGGATRRNVTIAGNFLNRAEQYCIRVGGVQGVDIGANYYGNYQLGTLTFSSCTGVRIHDADYDMGTMSVRTVITDNYTALPTDELIQVNGLNKTVTLPRADSFSAYGGKRYIVYNLLDTTTTIDLTDADAVAGAGVTTVVGRYSSKTLVASTPDGGSTFQWVLQADGKPLLDQIGTLTPEGAVSAPVSALFRRTDGSSSQVLYAKVSGSGNTVWENVYTAPYELQLTRLHRGVPQYGDATQWSTDEYGRQICNSTAGESIYFNLDLPDGVTLDSIEFTVVGGGGVGLPAVMPRFRLRRHGFAADTTASSSDAVDGSANIGAYNAIHTITLSSLATSVNASTRYVVEFVTESGAGATAGFTILGVTVTMTTRLHQLDRGSA